MGNLNFRNALDYLSLLWNEIDGICSDIKYNPEMSIPDLSEILNSITDGDGNTFVVNIDSSTEDGNYPLFERMIELSNLTIIESKSYINSFDMADYSASTTSNSIIIFRLISSCSKCINILERYIPYNLEPSLINTYELKNQLIDNSIIIDNVIHALRFSNVGNSTVLTACNIYKDSLECLLFKPDNGIYKRVDTSCKSCSVNNL